MPENVLIAWLCIMRYQLENDDPPCFRVPESIGELWVERGWIGTRVTENGSTDVWVTGKGMAVTYLNSADWGIDLLPKKED